ncbi:MAG: AraC family transcriptional regulator [Clostridia bacterium]|nr:AraC family transcriptional regulator [Clostridia bacterium]
MDIFKASDRLSELELSFIIDNLEINVLWFRIMHRPEGEWSIPRHMHSSFEFHFIKSGCCIVMLDDCEFIASEGGFYLTAPGIFHEQRAYKKNEILEYCINCEILVNNEQLTSEGAHIFNIFKKTECKCFKDTEGIINFFEKALNEAFYKNIGFYNNIKNLAQIILFLSARIMNENRSIKYIVPHKLKKDDYRVIQIENYIRDNIYKNLTAAEISKFMFLSQRHVCRIIEEKWGINTKKLIMKMKFEKSKELLKETDISVKEISEKLGFSSEYYFNQFFKNLEGFPPGLFRLQFRNDV